MDIFEVRRAKLMRGGATPQVLESSLPQLAPLGTCPWDELYRRKGAVT
jgi:hypothetical protein